MDWSNPIPNITYSIIAGAVFIVVGSLIKFTSKKLKEERDRIEKSLSAIEITMNVKTPSELRQSFITYFSAVLSSAKSYEMRLSFLSIFSFVITLWGMLTSMLLKGNIFFVVVSIIGLIVTAIAFYMTQRLGSAISKWEQTFCRELFKVTTDIARPISFSKDT